MRVAEAAGTESSVSRKLLWWGCPPYKCPDQPGTAVTQEEAIALAQAHKDRGRRRWVAEWLNAGCRVLGG